MADSVLEAQEDNAKDQPTEEETSPVSPVAAGEEASNNGEDPGPATAGKGGLDEDEEEASESTEQEQKSQDKVGLGSTALSLVDIPIVVNNDRAVLAPARNRSASN